METYLLQTHRRGGFFVYVLNLHIIIAIKYFFKFGNALTFYILHYLFILYYLISSNTAGGEVGKRREQHGHHTLGS